MFNRNNARDWASSNSTRNNESTNQSSIKNDWFIINKNTQDVYYVSKNLLRSLYYREFPPMPISISDIDLSDYNELTREEALKMAYNLVNDYKITLDIKAKALNAQVNDLKQAINFLNIFRNE